jgi:hypothetical protein
MATIIELSYNNATQQNLTSDWTNTFQQQVVLNPGDGLTTKLALLDYSSTGQYSNIEIPEDLNILMTGGFWYTIQDPTVYNSNQRDADGSDEDFDNIEIGKYYIARDSNYNLITSTKIFTIKKGVYDVNELTQQITRNITAINVDDIGKSIYFDNKAGEFFFRSTIANEMSVNIYSFYDEIQSSLGSGPLEGKREWIMYCIVKEENLWQLEPFSMGQSVSFAYQYDPKTNNFSDGVIIQLDKVAGTMQIRHYLDDFGLGDSTPGDGGLTVPPQPWTNFYGIVFGNNTTSIRFYDPENFNVNRAMYMEGRNYMGSSQLALLFNDNNDGKFSFKYMHTPFYNGGQESISVYNVVGATFYYFLAQSGIFFTQLEPASFWFGLLGFNQNILVSDNLITHTLNQKLVLGQNITSNLITYDNVFNKAKWTESPPIDTPYYTTSQDTFKIIGLELQTAFVSPYFIIQILGLGNTNLLDDNKTYQTIAQICSKQYDNNGVITTYPDNIPFYYNTSNEPLLISSLRVRILDGVSKQPTLILGNNNNIFIQIVKAIGN